MNILVFSTVAGNADNLLYFFKFLTKKSESHKDLKFHKQLIKHNFSSKCTTVEPSYIYIMMTSE